MHTLDWLSHHMEHCDTFAQWIHTQFSYEYAHLPLSEWQHEFAQGQSNGEWKCLIAQHHGQLLGGVALARSDLALKPDLGPWLACVFVAPQARGNGLAERLIERLCHHAKQTGITRLYLHTNDQSAYYGQRGWVLEEHFDAWGKAHSLMSRTL